MHDALFNSFNCTQICMDALMTARRMLAGHPALGGVKLTLLPFIIKVGWCWG